MTYWTQLKYWLVILPINIGTDNTQLEIGYKLSMGIFSLRITADRLVVKGLDKQ